MFTFKVRGVASPFPRAFQAIAANCFAFLLQNGVSPVRNIGSEPKSDLETSDLMVMHENTSKLNTPNIAFL